MLNRIKTVQYMDDISLIQILYFTAQINISSNMY